MNETLYGRLPDGREVKQFTVNNDRGLSLSVTDYGATVTDCIVPDRDGRPTNVVLGYGSLDGYVAGGGFFGATVGRIAGRLKGAAFEIDGTRYELAAGEAADRPDGGNHLHGGNVGFDKRLWTAEEPVSSAAAPDPGRSVRLRYLSSDGEEGYPGNLEVIVTFTVPSGANVVRIDYEARTDKATPFSPTNHSYFNLGGDDVASIEDHLLRIHADYYTPTDETMTHLGIVDAVDGTGADLRHERRIGEIMPGLLQQHGDNYLLRPPPTRANVEAAGLGPESPSRPEPRPVARATSPESGIQMTVATNAACLQFFGGRYIQGKPPARTGRDYGPFAGFCFECQEYPDGTNHPEICDIILRPGEVYRQRTEWRFAVQQ